MPFQLRLEDAPALSGGVAQTVVIAGPDVFRIGRQPDMDWVFPDPSCAVSSHHCDIRCEGQVVELHDLSTNGTFVNGQPGRMIGPHRLSDGDRFTVGPYVVTVAEQADDDGTREFRLPVDDDDTTQIVALPALPSLTVHIGAIGAADPPKAASKTLIGPGVLVIGRDPAADIVLPDRSGLISRRHCALQFDLAGCKLHDMSTNGIFRDGERLADGSRLHAGDTLRVGDYTLRLGVAGVREPAATAPPRRGGDPAAMVAPTRSLGAAPVVSEATAIGKPASARPADKTVLGQAVDPIIARVAAALGLVPGDIAQTDPVALAEQLASLVALVAKELRAVRLTQQDQTRVARPIEAVDNNPLEYFPSTEEALRTLFGPPRRAYLDPSRAVRQVFGELREHYSCSAAARHATAVAVAAALAPEAIEQSMRSTGKARILVGSRKAELWDAYVARWIGMTGGTAEGAVAAFETQYIKAFRTATTGS